jgi:hypothetical protein
VEHNGSAIIAGHKEEEKVVVTENMDLDDDMSTPIKESVSISMPNIIDDSITEGTEKKTSVKKISLQEYLSSKQQQHQEINHSSS